MNVPEQLPSDDGAEALQSDIEHTRQELASTVTQLAAKFDIPTRARHRVEDARAQLRRKIGPVALPAAAIAGVMVLLFVAARTWRSHRN